MPNTQFAFNVPSPYQSELDQIAQRQKMAEILQAQAFQPTERYSYKGIEAPIPATAGLAKMLQAYVGMKMQEKAADERRAVGERYRADEASDIESFGKMMQTPAVQAQPAFTPETADYEDNPNLRVVDGQVPAVAGRRAGQLDPSMLGQLKTPEIRRMALAQMLAQSTPGTPVKIGEGESLIDPRTGQVVFQGTPKGSFGQPQIEIIDGKTHAVAYDKDGNRKVLGPVTPQNQYSTPTADATARLRQQQYEFANISATDRARLANEAARLGISAAELWWNTGQRAGGGAALPPQVGAPPQAGSPQQAGAPAAPAQPVRVPPRPAPAPAAPAVPVATAAPADGVALTPRSRQELAVKGAEAEQKRAEQMRGLGDSITMARDILSNKGPTGSYGGMALDVAGRIVGTDVAGAAAARQLTAIAGNLTSKMPRMEGPQSEKDVAMYMQMAGDVGNASLPVVQRLAALKTVEDLYAKYDKTYVKPSGAPVRITGEADYAKLPSGSTFIGPDGKTRRKP